MYALRDEKFTVRTYAVWHTYGDLQLYSVIVLFLIEALTFLCLFG